MSCPSRYHGCVAKGKGSGPCTTYKKSRFCSRHSAMYYSRKAIDWDGNPIKEPTRNTYCTKCRAEGKRGNSPCHGKRTGIFCARHWSEVRWGFVDKETGKRTKKKRHVKATGCIAKGKPEATPCGKYRGGRFCTTHWKQWHDHKMIDYDGNVTRKRHYKRTPFTDCLAKGSKLVPCSKYQYGRFCPRHWYYVNRGHIDWKTGKDLLDKTKVSVMELPRSLRPTYDHCHADHLSPCGGRRGKWSKFCARHKAQIGLGIIDNDGNKLRDMRSEWKCGIPGCGGRAGFKWGYCNYHYTQIVRSGHIFDYPSLSQCPPGLEPENVDAGLRTIDEVMSDLTVS